MHRKGMRRHDSKKSPDGMLVQDPSKNNDVDEIFNQARQLGAVEGPLEHLHPSSSSTSFFGTGRLLSGEIVHSAPQPLEAVIHNIVFWKNGFTVDDGPLRRLDDPENASFLEAVHCDGRMGGGYIRGERFQVTQTPDQHNHLRHKN